MKARGRALAARWIVALAAALVVALASPRAWAHDFEPGVLAVREVASGRYAWAFTEPVSSSSSLSAGAEPVEVRFPPGCEASAGVVACGAGGLVGAVELVGLAAADVPVVVEVTRLGGDREEHVVFGRAPRVVLGEGRPGSLAAWVRLGLGHVLEGFDHLAFVVALAFVARGAKRVVATVTGFTLAHSLTLALAVKGLVTLPSAPVEACIAASVVLLAREAMAPPERPPTLARRFPWAVAFGFGLVHGLGFAEALRAIGLPTTSWVGPLAAFNVGIELGQLAVVLAVVLARRFVVPRLPHPARVERAALALVGGAAALWFVERAAALVGAAS